MEWLADRRKFMSKLLQRAVSHQHHRVRPTGSDLSDTLSALKNQEGWCYFFRICAGKLAPRVESESENRVCCSLETYPIAPKVNE